MIVKIKDIDFIEYDGGAAIPEQDCDQYATMLQTGEELVIWVTENMQPCYYADACKIKGAYMIGLKEVEVTIVSKGFASISLKSFNNA